MWRWAHSACGSRSICWLWDVDRCFSNCAGRTVAGIQMPFLGKLAGQLKDANKTYQCYLLELVQLLMVEHYFDGSEKVLTPTAPSIPQF